MQYVVEMHHPPDLCPTSNGKIRAMVKEGVKGVPDLAKSLGIEILTVRVYGPDHTILAIIESATIEPVREFVAQSRLGQWNTAHIYGTMSLDEAIAQADSLPAAF